GRSAAGARAVGVRGSAGLIRVEPHGRHRLTCRRMRANLPLYGRPRWRGLAFPPRLTVSAGLVPGDRPVRGERCPRAGCGRLQAASLPARPGRLCAGALARRSHRRFTVSVPVSPAASARPSPAGWPAAQTGTARVKRGMAEMLKGGVIMDVVTAEHARVAEDAGAVAVMALERVPADIRAQGGVARMSDPAMIEQIIG